MAKLPNPYRRLPGTGRAAFETARLYAAADHLLHVSSSGIAETYRRFYFRDIQSIVVRQSAHGKVWNAVWGSVCALLAAIALGINAPGAIVWWCITGGFLLVLAINIARGPTCVCQIRTAVQTRPLLPLSRLRRASKVIAQLKPLIEAAQGTLPPEEFTRRIDEARRGAATEPVTPVADNLANPAA